MQATDGLVKSTLITTLPEAPRKTRSKPDSAFAAGFSNAMFGPAEQREGQQNGSDFCETVDASLQWLDGWVEGSQRREKLLDGENRTATRPGRRQHHLSCNSAKHTTDELAVMLSAATNS